MHDYLNIFKDQNVINCLNSLRNKYNISIQSGTLSKQKEIVDADLSDTMIASIQLYEYILYDFLFNSILHDILNDDDRKSLYNVIKMVLGNQYNQESINVDLNNINTIIGNLIDHNKYCELYAKRTTPDYLKVFKDHNTIQNIEYLRIQFGISSIQGFASKPDTFQAIRWSNNLIAGIQLYEYIFYDFMLKQEIHDTLPEEERISFLNVLNAICNKNLDNPELEKDIIIANQIIKRFINNKKYFNLYSQSELSLPEEKMQFSNSTIYYISPELLKDGVSKRSHEYYLERKQAS